MESKKISVVIAVYNCADHLQKCLDSLEHQTMHASDFEIIFVNDCSTDESRNVIERHAARMKNITLINLEKNTGSPIIPRNTGMQHASGKYIHFMDDDDFLGDEALERLYIAAEKNKSDVIFGRHVGVNGRQVPQTLFGKGNVERASLLSDNLVFSLAPHKMFRSSFLKEHNIYFHPEAKGGNEDQLFVMQSYLKASCITLLDDYDYYFVVRRGEESFSRHRYKASTYFVVPWQIMEYMDKEVSDDTLRKKLKAIYIDRFLTTERLRRYLISTDTSIEVKQEWMEEGKKFLDTHLDREIVQMIDKSHMELIRLIQANDVAEIERAAQRRMAAQPMAQQREEAHFARAKRANSKAYARPSCKAFLSGISIPTERPFKVYVSVDRWLEVRHAEDPGNHDVSFVKQKDVRFSTRFKFKLFLKRVRRFLKRTFYKRLATL